MAIPFFTGMSRCFKKNSARFSGENQEKKAEDLAGQVIDEVEDTVAIITHQFQTKILGSETITDEETLQETLRRVKREKISSFFDRLASKKTGVAETPASLPPDPSKPFIPAPYIGLRTGGKPDYYKVLGVPYDAAPEQIKKAYHDLARKNHPDVNQDGADRIRFNEIREAFDTLSDEEKRTLYDFHIGLIERPKHYGRKHG